MSHAEWNRLVHIMHGNGTLKVFFNNCNGLQAPGRWSLIQNLPYDVVMLAETHATKVIQTSFSKDSAEGTVLWGEPILPRARTGVATIVKRGAAWTAQIVSPATPRAKRFIDQGRLMIV